MSKQTEPNWANIEKLRNHLRSLRQTKNRKFDMSNFIQVIKGKELGAVITVEDMRNNGPACGTAACLAGESVIALAPKSVKFKVIADHTFGYLALSRMAVYNTAKKVLGLNGDEANFMFNGHWSQYGTFNKKITKREAINYLNAVLKQRNIYAEGKL